MVIEYPVGNITQIRDGAQQTVYFDNAVVSPDQRFEYDPLYRLTHAEGREHTALTQPTHADLSFGPQPHPNDPSALRTYEEAYAWDEVGNLLQLQHAASGGNFTRQYVYAAAGNRLLSNSAPGESTAPFSHSYTYDAHGNMTAMPHLAAMAWDHADRLQHCDLGGGGDVWFVYDAAGNRVRKVQVNTSGSTVRERIYVGAWEVWRERTGAPLGVEQERQTLHVGDDRGKLALVETLTVDDGDSVATPISIQRHQHGNHLGSAALELDGSAAVISYEEFHPFGTSSYAANDSGVEVSAKRYRYIGKERDEETALYHLGARYYASWLGRWTAADPIGLGDGVNRYAYCRGNPIARRDPAGTAGEADRAAELLQQQAALVVSLTNAGSAAERAQFREKLHGVSEELSGELWKLRAQEAIAAADSPEGAARADAFRKRNPQLEQEYVTGGGNFTQRQLDAQRISRGINAARQGVAAAGTLWATDDVGLAELVGNATGAISSLSGPAASTLQRSRVPASGGRQVDSVVDMRKPEAVNLDTGSAVGLVSEGSSIRSQLKAALQGRTMVMTETALGEFRGTLRVAGPQEAARAGRFLKRVDIVPDSPSTRAVGLRITKKVGSNDRLIFGTGDQLGIPTMSADEKFVRGAAAQGVNFDVILHRPVPLTGR